CHVQAPRAVVLGGAYDAAQPLTEVLLQDLRVGGNQLRGEQVGLQLGPWEVGSLASLGMTAHNLDIRENIIRVLTVEGRGLSGVLPAQGGAPFVLRVAHNQIEAGQTAVWLKGGGVEVAHNKLDAQGQDTLVETPPTGVLTLVEAAGSLVEGNAVHLGKVGTGLCVRSSQDVRVRSNVVRCPEPGRPLWVLDSQRVEVGDNELEAGGCLVSAVQTLTVRGNRLAGLLSIQGSSNGVVSQNRLNRPTEASLAIDKARERWQLHENIAMGGIQLLPDIKGVTPPAVEEELEFQAQVQGNWASNLQVGYLHPDDSALLSVRDLPIAKPHPGSTVQVVANRAEGRLVVNHYGRFLITNNAIRELVCGVNALDRIEALNLSRPQGTGGQPPGGGGPPPGGGQTPGGTGVEEGLGRTLTPLPSGLLLVAGGADASGVCLKTAYLYNPFQDTWQQVGMMTTARAYHTATLLPSGLVMVVGGTDGAQTLASAELFDPNTREWSPILTGALGVARQRATAVLLGTGQVLVTGGVNKSGVLASTELFDSVKKTWTLLPQQMASPRTLHTATMLPTGQVLVSGGTNGTHFLATAEVYEPGARQWTLVGAMATARGRATATLLGTGAVLVSGGWNGQGPLSSAELYVPSGGTWTLVGTMAHSRQEHTATLLLSGRVLVMGGRGGGGLAQSTVELYDPRTRTWSLVTPMASARYGHLAVLLSSGMVLVASGVNGTTPLSS
ncbi:MAG TPA: kelch repeat-containing protein, partial [Archangium sp.]|nr:kelch repeat-containing protein [Archangium sp.]